MRSLDWTHTHIAEPSAMSSCFGALSVSGSVLVPSTLLRFSSTASCPTQSSALADWLPIVICFDSVLTHCQINENKTQRHENTNLHVCVYVCMCVLCICMYVRM